MIVHLIGSMRKFDEDLPYLRQIAETVYENDGTIANKWFDAVATRAANVSNREEKLLWPEIVSENIEVIGRSDVVIVEGSRFAFNSGYQVAIALQKRKPLLYLCRTNEDEYNWPDKLYVSGIEADELFTFEKYITKEELKEKVSMFINEHRTDKDSDFIELSGHTLSILKRLKATEGKMIEEIVQELVEREATK